MAHKPEAIKTLQGVFDKQRVRKDIFPVLVVLPKKETLSLSDAFSGSIENISAQSSQIPTVGWWKQDKRKGVRAILEPKTWAELENIVTRLERAGFQEKMSFAYEGHIIGHDSAFMKRNAENPAEFLRLYRNREVCIGMMRLFNGQGLQAKIPYKDLRSGETQWIDITPEDQEKPQDGQPSQYYTHADATAHHYDQ